MQVKNAALPHFFDFYFRRVKKELILAICHIVYVWQFWNTYLSDECFSDFGSLYIRKAIIYD
jgi:hypothetical protein